MKASWEFSDGMDWPSSYLISPSTEFNQHIREVNKNPSPHIRLRSAQYDLRNRARQTTRNAARFARHLSRTASVALRMHVGPARQHLPLSLTHHGANVLLHAISTDETLASKIVMVDALQTRGRR
jgi:hypothetical protein